MDNQTERTDLAGPEAQQSCRGAGEAPVGGMTARRSKTWMKATNAAPWPRLTASILALLIAGTAGGSQVAVTENGLAVVAEDRSLWTWGGKDAELGAGETGETRAHPGEVLTVTGVAAIAAGSKHYLALLEDGTLWSWGRMEEGRRESEHDGRHLGHGEDRHEPEPRSLHHRARLEDRRFLRIAVGKYFNLALDENGSLRSAGRSEVDESALGGGGNWAVIEFPGEEVEIVDFAAGLNHALAVDGHGDLWAWGSNEDGQLGDPDLGESCTTPCQVRVEGVEFRAVAAGDRFSLALDSNGRVWSWGISGDHISWRSHFDGRLGHPDEYGDRIKEPKRIESLANIIAIAAGEDFAVALDEQGEGWGWGSNENYRLGSDNTEVDYVHEPERMLPDLIEGETIIGITAGWGGHAAAYSRVADTEERRVLAWGDNTIGDGEGLGVGRTTDRVARPLPVLTSEGGNAASFSSFGRDSVPAYLQTSWQAGGGWRIASADHARQGTNALRPDPVEPGEEAAVRIKGDVHGQGEVAFDVYVDQPGEVVFRIDGEIRARIARSDNSGWKTVERPIPADGARVLEWAWRPEHSSSPAEEDFTRPPDVWIDSLRTPAVHIMADQAAYILAALEVVETGSVAAELELEITEVQLYGGLKGEEVEIRIEIPGAGDPDPMPLEDFHDGPKTVTLDGLSSETDYEPRVRADLPGGETLDLGGTQFTTQPFVAERIAADSGGASSDENCFIATAAHGSADTRNVAILRDFRDEVLARSAAGRYLIDLYYRHSPPLAGVIAERPWLAAVTRFLLWPFVMLAWLSLQWPAPLWIATG